VRCLTPELQLRHHLGYTPDDHDRRDIRLLADRFGLAPPAGILIGFCRRPPPMVLDRLVGLPVESVKHERKALLEAEASRVDADGRIPSGASRMLRPRVFRLHPLLTLRCTGERLVETRKDDHELPRQPVELRSPVTLKCVWLEDVVDRDVATAAGERAGERARRLNAEAVLRGLEIAGFLRVGAPADDQVPDLVELDVRRLRTRRAPRASKRRFPRPCRAAEEGDYRRAVLHVARR
jgi:hypothetical protein